MTWEIFVGITVLFGFGVAVVTPLIKLNSSITKLNCAIDTLNTNLSTTDSRVTEHGKQIEDHERRITILEVEKSMK